MKKAYIREIFLSIQGEGPYVGEQQLFIRFCGCNLNCAYCDTDFDISKSKEYSADVLRNVVNTYGKNLTLSLTGGEPLVNADFLLEFLPLIKKDGHKIYLETNGTLPEALQKVINYIDIVSADIKLESSTNQSLSYDKFDKFFKIASKKEVFGKVVFDKEITESEIDNAVNLAKKYGFTIILQPKMIGDKLSDCPSDCESVLKKFVSKYKNVRLIPQIHKFINVR